MAKRVDLPEEDKRKLSKDNIKKLLGVFNFMLPYKGYFIGGMIALFLSSSIVMIFPYITVELLIAIPPGVSPEIPKSVDSLEQI